MDRNCWKDENTDIFSFTAVVFNEKNRDQGTRGQGLMISW